MKRKLGLFLMILGLLTAASGAVLLVHNRTEDRRAGDISRAVLAQMEPLILDNIQALPTEPEPENPSVPAETQPPVLQMPVEEIDGLPYVGILSIPCIDRELPVLDALNQEGLQYAPCRYSGTTYQDNLVVGGHSYYRHFGWLYELEPGDEVFFTDMDGIVTAYQVTSTEYLRPSDLDLLLGSPDDLTLFTCTFVGNKRVTVRCNRRFS